MEQLWLTILGVTSIILEMGFISGIGLLFDWPWSFISSRVNRI